MNDFLSGILGVGIVPLFCCLAQAGTLSAENETLNVLRDSAARLHRTILTNGMVCLVHEDHSAPVVAIQIWFGTGAIHEEEYLGAGLSHYIEHMIFKGTPTRKPGDITREINEAGGRINAYTSQDRTVFHTDLPSRNWETGLNILFDAVKHASFPEEECRKEKDVILREMAMCADDPDRVLNEKLWSTAFTVHPYRFPVIGYAEIFRNITRDDLVRFFQRHYVPDNMIVVVAGDIDPARVEAALTALAADFPRQPRAPVILPAEPPQLAPRLTRSAGPYKVSRLHVAWHGVALTDPDAAALDVLATMAGRGRSSRLNRDIKENRRLVHSIDAWSFTPKDPGLFGISATFEPGKEDEVLAAIDAQVASWARKPFTRAELEKARKMTRAGELAELQAMDGLAGKFASGEYYAHDPAFSETYLRRIQEVTESDIRRVARQYLQPANRTIAVLNPAVTTEVAVASASNVPSAVRRAQMANGVPLLTREDHRLPFVYFCAAFNGGLLFESPENNGVTRLMSELLTRGTKSRSAEQIAEEVESMGADLSAFSGYNSFGLQGRCLKEDAPRFLAIMADCLVNPAFPAAEVDKQKAVQLAAIQEQSEQPFFLAQQGLQEMIFPNHPYRWDPLGGSATVERLTARELAAYHRRLLVTGNMVLSVFGDLNAETARKMAEPAFRHLRTAGPIAAGCGLPQPVLPDTRERREPRKQTIFLAGFPGVGVRDPRRDALALLETAMSGLSGGLAQEIREKRGLAYYMGASQRPGIDAGLFMVYTGTREEALPEVRGLIAAEIQRVTTQGLTAAELERARSQIIANHEMGLQDNLGLAMSCALNELYGLGYAYDFSTKERMTALTIDKVREAAASVLSTNRQAISIVLPEGK